MHKKEPCILPKKSFKKILCCRVLQRGAACCSVKRALYTTSYRTYYINESYRHTHAHSHILHPQTQNTLQRTAVLCNTHTATHCNTLQHTATQCNTLQHTAIHCNIQTRNAMKEPTCKLPPSSAPPHPLSLSLSLCLAHPHRQNPASCVLELSDAAPPPSQHPDCRRQGKSQPQKHASVEKTDALLALPEAA